jgi:N-acetylmuramoyl-L-alanine amidase
MKLTPIIDCGHGGVAKNWYCTPGKRSPNGMPEGWNNRRVGAAVHAELYNRGYRPVDLLKGSPMDVPLGYRIKYINGLTEHLHKQDYPQPVLISIHSNAAGNTWHPARGITTFTGKYSVLGNQIGAFIHVELTKRFSVEGYGEEGTWDMPDRGIKHPTWRHRIAIIQKTVPPAVLLELGFHTNEEDLEIMGRPEYPRRVAVAVANGLDRWQAERGQ